MTEDSGDSGYQLDGVDYSTNTTDLYLTITSVTNSVIEGATNQQALLVIHNTTNAVYEILSSRVVTTALSNWTSEGLWIGHPTNTPANVAVADRTNQLFIRARQWNGVFDHGIPTNGQLFLLLSNTNTISAIVNGTTNSLTPFYGNYVMARLPSTNGDILQTYYLNVGYDHSDGGDTNYLSDFPPQNVAGLLGFSRTVSNLCLTSNLLTELNVSGWPALFDLECWHCTNMLTVSVTNCPKLNRACFEAIQYNTAVGITNKLDFTGCTNIAEIRAADNRFPNIVLTNGAGPQVWHFCVHDNTVNTLPANFDFSHFPSLKELWVWDNQFSGPLSLTTANSTNLISVEAFNNGFTSADVTGQTNLDHIFVQGNAGLTNLLVSGCAKLQVVRATGDGLSTSVADSILSDLDAMGVVYNGANQPEVRLDNGTNAVPSVDGQRHAANLMNKGWTVFYNLPPVGTPNISAVSVTSVGSNTVTITWTTDVASDSTVYYSTTKASYLSTNVSASLTSHSVTVTGLTAATNYYFYVHSTAGSYTGTSADYQFVTRGGPGIYFVHTSSTVSMQIAVTGSPTISWLWSDGTATAGSTSVSHSFAGNGVSSVVVSPASALTGFGLNCGSATALDQVAGLTNYPNLQELHLYQSGLTNISLAGCSNLVSIALVSTSPSSAVENAWFNDLADTEPAMPSGSTRFSCGNTLHVFYFPTTPGTNSTSATASAHLRGIGWDLQHYP